MATKPPTGFGTTTSNEENDRLVEEDIFEESAATDSPVPERTKTNVIPFRKATRRSTGGIAEPESDYYEEADPTTATSAREQSQVEVEVGMDESESSHPSITSVYYQEIVRAHFFGPILEALSEIQPNVNSPSASVYVNTILHAIRDMEDKSPDDPFLDILYGFYDALAYENNWAKYNVQQYANAKNILENLFDRPTITPDVIEKAILALEEIGFQTMPFSFSAEEGK